MQVVSRSLLLIKHTTRPKSNEFDLYVFAILIPRLMPASRTPFPTIHLAPKPRLIRIFSFFSSFLSDDGTNGPHDQVAMSCTACLEAVKRSLNKSLGSRLLSVDGDMQEQVRQQTDMTLCMTAKERGEEDHDDDDDGDSGGCLSSRIRVCGDGNESPASDLPAAPRDHSSCFCPDHVREGRCF